MLSKNNQPYNSTVPDFLIPENDADRLKALYRYEILDTPTEAFFEKITSFARKIFEVPSAFISLVDLDRVWYKSNLSSLPLTEVKREDSLCSITILEPDEVTVFSDTQQVPQLLNSPYIKTEGGIRFYAGAPLKTLDGFNLGTVCVVDSKPRDITNKEKDALKDLATLVVDQLELRAASLKAVRKHDGLHSGISSEVLVPLEQLIEHLEEATTGKGSQTTTQKAIGLAREIGESMLHNTQALLLESSQAEDLYLLQPVTISMAEVARSVVEEIKPAASAKQQEIYFMVATGRLFRVDVQLMGQAFKYLLNFGVIYSPPQTYIALDIFEADNQLHLEFTYDGIDLSQQDLRKLFLRYARLEIKPTNNEVLAGDELYQAKKIIEQHNGTITVKNFEKGKSSKIAITFPVE